MFTPNLEGFLPRLVVPSGHRRSLIDPVPSSTLRRSSSAARSACLSPLSQISCQRSPRLPRRTLPAIFFPLASKSFQCNAYKKQGRASEPLGPYITRLSASSVTRRNSRNSNPIMQLLHNLRTPRVGGPPQKNRLGDPRRPRHERHDSTHPGRSMHLNPARALFLQLSTFDFSTPQVQSPPLAQESLI